MSAADVRRAWDRFVGVLAAHAPVSHAALRPPPTDVDAVIALAETDLSLDLGEDLRTWFSLHDGDAEIQWLFPDGMLVGMAESVSLTRMMRGALAELQDPDQVATSSSAPATTWSFDNWLPEYVVVFSDTCGDYGFADLRGGQLRGAIRHWAKGDGDSDRHDGTTAGSRARDVVEYVDRVTECLATGRPYPGRNWTLTRANGTAYWH